MFIIQLSNCHEIFYNTICKDKGLSEWFCKRSFKGNQNIICRAFCRWQRNQFPFVHKINKIILRTRLYFAPLWLDIHSQVRRVDSQITKVKNNTKIEFTPPWLNYAPSLKCLHPAIHSNELSQSQHKVRCALWVWGPALPGPGHQDSWDTEDDWALECWVHPVPLPVT